MHFEVIHWEQTFGQEMFLLMHFFCILKQKKSEKKYYEHNMVLARRLYLQQIQEFRVVLMTTTFDCFYLYFSSKEQIQTVKARWRQ